MGAILIALAPLIANLAAGEALHVALSAVTTTQWAALAADVLNVVEPSAVAKLKAIHPMIAAFLTEIENGKKPDLAADAIFAFFSTSYRPPTISGYDAHGAVIQIPNPDLRS